jgi:serine/threonine protein kinase
MTKSFEDATVVTDAPGGSDAGRREGERYPKKFGHYEILRELGRGGMATVYEALDTKLQRKVALKVPHKSVAADPEYMSRFIREARSAATLFHPNICPVFEVGDIGETPYLTMAYLEGKNLSDYILEEHPIPPKRIANIVRKIAQAMDAAHKQGIVHRDLKPSNIMIDARKEPVVMDFGLARRDGGGEESKLTQDGLLIGTPIYMAPEVAKKGAAYSGAITDVYSLGAILYELLAGKPPYKGTVQSVLVQVMRGEPKPPSTHREDLDPLIEAICLKAMAKDPKDRYASMAEFAAALKDYIQNADSAPTNLVEVVEVEPEPASKPDSAVGRSGPNKKLAVDKTPSPTARSAAAQSARRTPVRKTRKKDNTVALVAALTGAAVLAIVVAVTAIMLLKRASRDAPPSTEQTLASPAPAPAQTQGADPNAPDDPPPAEDDVHALPWADAEHPVAADVEKVRIPANFRGFLPVHFAPIESSDGLYYLYYPRITVNGRSIEVHGSADAPDPSKLWPHVSADSPLKPVDPEYRLHSNWLGPLKAGEKIHVELRVGLFYPPEHRTILLKPRKVTLYVVDPEQKPSAS